MYDMNGGLDFILSSTIVYQTVCNFGKNLLFIAIGKTLEKVSIITMMTDSSK